jgi:cytochrome c peroxidase
MKKWVVLASIFMGTLLLGCFGKATEPAHKKAVSVYLKNIDTLVLEANRLVDLIKAEAGEQRLQTQFLAARIAYKKTEWLAEYYNPYTAKSINGPAIPEVEADEKNKIITPEGFQVVEELLFPAYNIKDHNVLLQQAKILQSNIKRLQFVASVLQTSDAHIFDAMRLQFFRIISLGISGFDAPIANNSTAEAAASIQSMQDSYLVYANTLSTRNHLLADTVNSLFN